MPEHSIQRRFAWHACLRANGGGATRGPILVAAGLLEGWIQLGRCCSLSCSSWHGMIRSQQLQLSPCTLWIQSFYRMHHTVMAFLSSGMRQQWGWQPWSWGYSSGDRLSSWRVFEAVSALAHRPATNYHIHWGPKALDAAAGQTLHLPVAHL